MIPNKKMTYFTAHSVSLTDTSSTWVSCYGTTKSVSRVYLKVDGIWHIARETYYRGALIRRTALRPATQKELDDLRRAYLRGVA